MSVKFRWEGDDTGQWLYAGGNENDLAWLQPSSSGKRWRATSWLPGVRASKEYATLDEQKADIEAKVQLWFSQAAER
ncbi:hypothetical protein [Brucella intermedia]|uniref:hypothetical protein n=1 Tax=Brucella intermedia TaxID=94625 RepID=UPI00159147D9|nr:hypothetical protein [Brucella intermedia]